MVKIFLDDIRFPYWVYGDDPDGWTILRSYDGFKKWLEENKRLPDVISFDHDLGDEMTGYDVAKLIGEFCMDKKERGEKVILPKYFIHSANPVGSKNIYNYMKNLEKEMEKQ